jgi:catechol 2,3-dioxygenase-like lactoylglutathione lyase family enzyme
MQSLGVECDLERLAHLARVGELDARAFVLWDLVHLAFQVESLDECMARLKEAGVPITEGPIETSDGTKFIFTEDPDRYEIELMQMKA